LRRIQARIILGLMDGDCGLSRDRLLELRIHGLDLAVDVSVARVTICAGNVGYVSHRGLLNMLGSKALDHDRSNRTFRGTTRRQDGQSGRLNPASSFGKSTRTTRRGISSSR